MSQRKRNTLWALGLLGMCLFVVGGMHTLGLLPWKADAKVKFEQLHKKQVADARAEVNEFIKAAPRMSPESLKQAVKTAVRAEQLDVAGFFLFAWQARYQMEIAMFPEGIPQNKHREVLYRPDMYGFWVSGGKPASIRELEERPVEFIAAIDRFLTWRPQFDADDFPTGADQNGLDRSVRELLGAAVLQDFRTALTKLADNYSIPEYAKAASDYARERNQLFPDRSLKSIPLMRDVTWKFAPETRWHNRSKLNAINYFDDPGSLALCRAIEADDLDQMERLVADGVDVNRVGKGGMTALLWAMPDYRLKRFECLLRHGADPNVALESDFEGTRHPLFLNPDRLPENMLDNGCGPGDSVMMLSCCAPIESLRLVLQHGGNPNLVHSINNSIPLDVASQRWTLLDSEARGALLLEHGADGR